MYFFQLFNKGTDKLKQVNIASVWQYLLHTNEPLCVRVFWRKCAKRISVFNSFIFREIMLCADVMRLCSICMSCTNDIYEASTNISLISHTRIALAVVRECYTDDNGSHWKHDFLHAPNP